MCSDVSHGYVPCKAQGHQHRSSVFRVSMAADIASSIIKFKAAHLSLRDGTPGFKRLTSSQGYSTNSIGELFKVSMPLVSTKDDISKNFLLSGG